MSTALPEVPRSYAIVLPPGWIRVSLTGTVQQAVKDLVERMFQHVPRDEALEARRIFEARMTEMIREARARNGLDLYLPVKQMHGRTISASFIVGGVVLPGEVDSLESLALLGDLSKSGTPVAIDGEMGIRAERVEPVESQEQSDVDTRRVDYMFPLPGDDRRWIVVTFSTPGETAPDDQVADAPVQLFDAMMTTFRWQW